MSIYQHTLFEEDEAIFVNDYKIRPIQYRECLPFILELHYAKRVPSVIKYIYGLFHEKELVGIITYGMPASNFLCEGVAGVENKEKVLELSRLVLKNNKKNEASILISASLKLLPQPKIIVSYADTEQNHLGVVYQATNFIFTGTTKERTDMAGTEGKHARHNLGDVEKRIKRSAKHRYIYIVANKKDKKTLLKQLNYKEKKYPKNFN